MDKIIKKRDLILLSLIVIVGAFFFSNHIYSIIGDVGREVYYPKLILDNQVLFKDIFNIFGPFAYLFNAILYKIFGANLSVLVFVGYFTALSVVLGTYMLAKQFLDRNTSFLIALFVSAAGIYTIHDFRYMFCPYTYAILYGLIAFIWGLYFFSKYFQTNNNKYIYLTSFLTGLACCSKYEFLLFALFLFVFLIFNKKDFKTLTLSLLCFLASVIICFAYLFYQGLTVKDFVASLVLIKNLVATDAYQYFYKVNNGTFFSVSSIKILGLAAAKFIGFYLLFAIAFKLFRKEKPITIMLFVFPLLYFIYLVYSSAGMDEILCYIPVFCSILFIIQYKTLDIREKFIIVCTLLVSLKVFLNCNIRFYGVYFLPALLIILFILLKKYPQLNVAFKIYTLLVLFGLLSVNIMERQTFGIPVQNINLYTQNSMAYKMGQAIQYIKENTDENDTVVVFPDGLLINFETGRPVSKQYNSAQAPYLELFKEENYIKYFTENKPEIFILTNKGQWEYNQSRMCDSYANALCEFIRENYKEVVIFRFNNDDEPFYIYRKID